MVKQQPSRRSVLRAPLALAALGSTSRALAAQDGGSAQPEAPVKGGVRRGNIRQAGVGWCYGGPLEELCQLCVELGLDAIDIAHPRDFPLLKKYGLQSSMTVSMERGIGITNSFNRKENHELGLEVLKQRIDENAAAGFHNVIVFSGNRAEGLSDAEGLANCAEALRQLVGYAEERGQTLHIEYLNSKRDHAGYMFDNIAWGAELIQRVGSDALKILFDIYHAQIMEGDVIATIREHHAIIGHYHTAGVPGRRDLDDSQELYYPAIMRAIVETGFEGVVGQEFIPKGDRRQALKRAVELCDV